MSYITAENHTKWSLGLQQKTTRKIRLPISGP